MDLCFQTFALLFLLFAATSCAPGPRLQDPWAVLRNSSLELRRMAKQESVKARNGSKDINNVASELAWIEAEDKCDPESLKKKPETCLAKILSVSMSYSSELEKFSKYESCAAKRLIPAIKTLQRDMRACVKVDVPPVKEKACSDISRWEIQPLCLYTLERLFSFSILTARVFAVGDPSHHATVPQGCTAAAAERCSC